MTVEHEAFVAVLVAEADLSRYQQSLALADLTIFLASTDYMVERLAELIDPTSHDLAVELPATIRDAARRVVTARWHLTTGRRPTRSAIDEDPRRHSACRGDARSAPLRVRRIATRRRLSHR